MGRGKGREAAQMGAFFQVWGKLGQVCVLALHPASLGEQCACASACSGCGRHRVSPGGENPRPGGVHVIVGETTQNNNL